MNPKHGIPRIPSAGGFSFSRGHFLDGSIRVFFGPGQTPGVTQAYEPPTAWPAAGTLLRMPQVVCLSCLPLGLNEFADEDGVTASSDYYVDFGGDPTTRHTATATVTNAGTAEYTRMQSVLAEVKTRIEALRPNRTWVIDADYLVLLAGTWNFPMNGYLPIMAPDDIDPPRYLGTDFLHIYIGHIWVGDATPEAEPWPFPFAGPYVDPAALLDDTDYTDARSRIVASYDKFRRHATLLYSEDSLNWTDVIEDSAVESYISDGYEVVGNSFDARTALNATRMGAIATDLADYGVTYVGDGTGLDADALVTKIAEHYGFDPSTGADLG